ncbi:hypothetical protein [Rossellomorea sp. NPDC077527]|uniref:hypothetical protein n=1 Tax=Rossellomorea sp. NPDC077527 TaxID=3364510 RepID=UPI0037C80E55
MKKILFSFMCVLLMNLCIFVFTDILSNTLSWKTILIAAVGSVLLNGLFVSIWYPQGNFYKRGLYPMVFYQVFFLLVIGIVVIASSDKQYIVDAWDGLSPYAMLVLVSMIHGLVMLVMVKWNRKFV